jgi:2-phospho-L-lactate guanylyltransferase (CobY/MobA/RfbA family)
MIGSLEYESGNGNGNGYHIQKRAITICSDHTNEGTNALLLSPPTGFVYRYGDDSFQQHLDEAERLGMKRRIVNTPGITFDLDTEHDWETYHVMMNPEPVI